MVRRLGGLPDLYTSTAEDVANGTLRKAASKLAVLVSRRDTATCVLPTPRMGGSRLAASACTREDMKVPAGFPGALRAMGHHH